MGILFLVWPSHVTERLLWTFVCFIVEYMSDHCFAYLSMSQVDLCYWPAFIGQFPQYGQKRNIFHTALPHSRETQPAS